MAFTPPGGHHSFRRSSTPALASMVRGHFAPKADGRLVGRDANALASSVVLVCRASATAAADRNSRGIHPRAQARNARRHRRHPQSGRRPRRHAAVGDRAGHGRVHALSQKVLESDDSPMSVKTALSLINRVWEEIENELDANFDPETQVALAWFASYGYEAKKSGELNAARQRQERARARLFRRASFSRTCMARRR